MYCHRLSENLSVTPPVWRLWEVVALSANTGAYDLAIVGAGMAGSALAAALRGQGLSIALIEARPVTLPSLPELADLGSFDARVSALNMQSIALLQQLGAWSAISNYRACAYP